MSARLCFAFALFFGLSPLGTANAEDGYKKLARKLTTAAKKAKAGKVAVLPFVFLNRPVSVAPWLVSERLTTRMSGKPGVALIERQLVGKLLSEQRLGLTGALDSSKSTRIGRLLNVDALVLGTMVNRGDGKIELNARLIHAEDGRILEAAQAEVDEDWKEDAQSALLRGKGRHEDGSLDLGMISIPESLFQQRCASCHGASGEGTTAVQRREAGVDLTRPAVQRKSDHELALQIQAGGSMMPPNGDPTRLTLELNETEVSSLTGLIRRLGRDRAIRESEQKAGGRLFEQHCAACHGYDGRGSHLASGLFEVPLENLDLTKGGVSALGNEELSRLIKKNKRKMLFRPDVSEDVMTRVWLYLQKLSLSGR